MVDATTSVPGRGSVTPSRVSITQRSARNHSIRRGCTTPARTTVPARSRTMIEIGFFMLKVCTERVRSSTDRSAMGPMPIYRSAREASTVTLPIDHSSALRCTAGCFRRRYFALRYIRPAGTLVALWQRQKDANSELAAQRRTTAANPTLVAGSSASRLAQSYDFVPPSCYTTRSN